ncbi:unnamed protein product [Arabidopsis thaliana]|uniref:(thale cress) hypothetical protein n=1 Tax=Arabidopsis thaliana TaxID=3702 RepID=A0A7G2FD08_ARATH|nr:unnamed protein product [Arabidopsis thaliana]
MLIKKYDMKDFKSVKPKEHIKLLKTQKLPLTTLELPSSFLSSQSFSQEPIS